MKLIKTIAALSLFIVAVSITAATSIRDTNQKNAINYKDGFGLEIKNNQIFFNGEKRGWVSGNRIYINFQHNVYSFKFEDGIEKLSFDPIGDAMSFRASIIYYNGLTINLPTKDEPTKISFKCDGPLLSGNRYEYCKTNNKNYLEQYEFGQAYRQFSTGADIALLWRKISIKNTGRKNIVFEGRLNGAYILYPEECSDFEEQFTIYKSLLKYKLIKDLGINTKVPITILSDASAKEIADHNKARKLLAPIKLKMRNMVKSNAYLDKIKEDPENKELERSWEGIVNSFSINDKF